MTCRRARQIPLLAAVLGALLAAALISAESSAAKAPKGFFGIHVRGLEGGNFAHMRRTNVGAVRTGFNYSAARRQSDQPFDWRVFDRYVTGTADNGMALLPVVYGFPGWVPAGRGSILEEPARSAWREYLRALVARYGSRGEFWAENPDVEYRPLRHWQIWNEPNSFVNWHDPNPREYGKLLARSARIIHAADPRAKVIAAGVIAKPLNSSAERGASYLRRMFRSKAAARAADVIAVHPYAQTPGEAMKLIKKARKRMNRSGLRKTPIWITEMGWGSESKKRRPRPASSPPASAAWDMSPKKQRRKMRRFFDRVVKQRRTLKVRRVVWYQWQDHPAEPCPWCRTAGLLDENGSPKRLLRVFKRIARN
jgi:hypothetical protein